MNALPNQALPAQALSVWVLDEGRRGHLNQSLGLLDALARQVEVRSEVVPARFVVPGWLRTVVRTAVIRSREIPDRLIRRCYRDLRLPSGRPDIVISSGGRSIPLALWLRQRFACRQVYLGEVRPYPTHLFDVLLTPVAQPGATHVVPTELLVTRVTPDDFDLARNVTRAAFGVGERECTAAMLIGGASRSHVFREGDWRELADGINATRAHHGWRWLLTTSPRTGTAVEALLRKSIDPDALTNAVWWGEQRHSVVRQYLAAADVVYVTSDSLTMVSEAVASGKPTVAVRPHKIRHSAYVEDALGAAADNRRILRVTCDSLPASAGSLQTLRPLTQAPGDRYAGALLDLLPTR